MLSSRLLAGSESLRFLGDRTGYITFSLEYDGDLADSLRAVASLVEEYGQDFVDNPDGYVGWYDGGSVHRVEINPERSELSDLVGDGGAE